MLLEGRSAVVTGVGPGIGRAVALALSRHGARVALGARTASTLEKVAAEMDGETICVPTNIAEHADCRRLAEAAAAAFGGIDIVVQNAFMHGPFGGAVGSDPDDWRKVYKVNVIGTLQMVQACLPHMAAGSAGAPPDRDGSIVVTNSMASRTSTPLESAYAASKAAMLSLVRTLAQELGPRAIRVNSVLPGWVLGPSLDVYFEWLANERGCSPAEVHDEIAGETALKRLVTPEDIAGAIVFLASDLSRGITGISLDVNSGHHFPP